MITPQEFNKEIIRLSTQVAQPSVIKIKEFILKAAGARVQDLSEAQHAWLEMCGFTIHLEGLMHFSDPTHESREALASFDYNQRMVYFSVHLVEQCLVVRSASEPGRYTDYVEIPSVDFGLVPNANKP